MASMGTHHLPCVGLTAGLQQGQQHGIVLITTVIQCLLVEVGQELHSLQTAGRSRVAGDHPSKHDKNAQFKGGRQAPT